MSTEIVKAVPNQPVSILKSIGAFREWMEVAETLSKSSVVPATYQKNKENCIVAIELANRIGVSPLMVMQNLDIIKGKPSWSGAFVIAAINSCGRFTPLKFVWEGEKGTDSYGCRAVTTTMDGEMIKGTLISWTMVKGEGWLQKEGSKWKTMPEQMFQYRAASFFGRVHCPDVLFGMQTIEETIDVVGEVMQEDRHEQLLELFEANKDKLPEDAREGILRVISNKELNLYAKAITHLKTLSDV